jgi:formate dehydrogenase major subunit
MVRAAFGNNNVDTCARVCHSPTGYGLNQTFGTSAGTQDFASVEQADVMLVIGANPTDAHPVFALADEARLREGAKAIVADPRRIDLVRSPHVEAAPPAGAPGTNVAFVNAMATSSSPRGCGTTPPSSRERCEDVDAYLAFIAGPEHSPEATRGGDRHPVAPDLRAAARLYAAGPNSAIYYGLGVTEHSQGSTMVMGMANLAMLTGNLGREGVGVNPLRGQNNVQGSCDMGSFPHELPGYRHVSRTEVREIYESLWGVTLQAEPGLRIPNMFDSAIGGSFRGLYVQGEDIAQSDPNTRTSRPRCAAMELVVVQDLFLNETARFAHVFLPGTSFLEKDGTFTNAERRINRVRPVMPSRVGKDEWQVVCEIATAMGYPMSYAARRRSWTRSPPRHRRSPGCRSTASTPRARCSGRSHRPRRTARRHARRRVRARQGPLDRDRVRADDRAHHRRFPLRADDRAHPQQYNVGAQTRRTPNSTWHPEDVLEIHPPTPRCGASSRATSSSWLVEGRRHAPAAQVSVTGCRPASSTRRSTTRSPAPTS